MRLDELDYPGWVPEHAVIKPATPLDLRGVGGSRVRVWKYPNGQFTVERERPGKHYETWAELDALSAQAVLYHLLDSET